MSISSEITRIETAKEDIKTAIIAKGVSIPEAATIGTYATYVEQIKSLNFYQFNFDASSWDSNSSTTTFLNKYQKSFSLPSGMNSNSNIVSYVQVPYDSVSFSSNELDACYSWSEVEINDSNIIFYSSENININFSIIIYYE